MLSASGSRAHSGDDLARPLRLGRDPVLRRGGGQAARRASSAVSRSSGQRVAPSAATRPVQLAAAGHHDQAAGRAGQQRAHLARRRGRCRARSASARRRAGCGRGPPARPGSAGIRAAALRRRPGTRGSPRPVSSAARPGRSRAGSRTAARRGTGPRPGGPSARPARSCRPRPSPSITTVAARERRSPPASWSALPAPRPGREMRRRRGQLPGHGHYRRWSRAARGKLAAGVVTVDRVQVVVPVLEPGQLAANQPGQDSSGVGGGVDRLEQEVNLDRARPARVDRSACITCCAAASSRS